MNFELELLDCIAEMENRKEDFYKLSCDGKCLYDDFCKKVQKSGNFKNDLIKVESIIAILSEGRPMPQLKKLSGRKEKTDPYQDYELKVGRLRVYLFKDEDTGNVIVLGEIKKDIKQQRIHIATLRDIKLAYFKKKLAYTGEEE